MATEWRRGILEELTTKLAADADMRCKKALTAVALVIERQAKINASNGAHKLGTPTPARENEGPAVISGNLRRSITHTPVTRVGMEWQTKVGTALGFFPPYGVTPASEYGYYLEKYLLPNGAGYPFLEPAFEFGIKVPADLIYKEYFGSRWRKLV